MLQYVFINYLHFKTWSKIIIYHHSMIVYLSIRKKEHFIWKLTSQNLYHLWL